jgi:hypothetical protein
MRRAFDLDVLRCPRCAGRMELIATINDPCQDRSTLSRKHRNEMSPVQRPSCPLAHASAPTSSSSSSAAGLGLRPSRPAFFFSRSR